MEILNSHHPDDIERIFLNENHPYSGIAGINSFSKQIIGYFKRKANISKRAGLLLDYLCEIYNFAILRKSLIAKINVLKCSSESGIGRQNIKLIFSELTNNNQIIVMNPNEDSLRGNISFIIPFMLHESCKDSCIRFLSDWLSLDIDIATRVFEEHMSVSSTITLDSIVQGMSCCQPLMNLD